MRYDGLDRLIKEILYGYIGAKSDTATIYERNSERFLLAYISKLEYFKKNKDLYGCYQLKNDSLNRGVVWALVKGDGDDTVVLVHHSDVVDVLDFKGLKDYAYLPDRLKIELTNIKDDLSDEASTDLISGKYLFGRGSADMKSGGAIQLALLSQYAKRKIKGNVLMIAVPDEESTSAGMRSALYLLDELNNAYGLNYLGMINSEPHQRKKKDVGIISEGSVGKIMPLIYVRGNLAHVGKVFEGFNPATLLSRIVVDTDLSMELTDIIEREGAPPPTWIYMKDSKTHYDVSMPLSATGYFSILTLDSTPKDILDKLCGICKTSFDKHIVDMNNKYLCYCNKLGKKHNRLPWDSNVVTYEMLYSEALENYGDIFRQEFKASYNRICDLIDCNRMDLMEGTRELIEFTYNYINDLSPRVVIALAPPYYPNVSNLFIDDNSHIFDLSKAVSNYARDRYNQCYEREYFFTGISDLSYTSIKNHEDIKEDLENNMVLYGDLYSIPLEVISKYSMPAFNIGPWGKDFHKLTERALKEDIYIRTPDLLDYGIGYILGWYS